MEGWFFDGEIESVFGEVGHFFPELLGTDVLVVRVGYFDDSALLMGTIFRLFLLRFLFFLAFGLVRLVLFFALLNPYQLGNLGRPGEKAVEHVGDGCGEVQRVDLSEGVSENAFEAAHQNCPLQADLDLDCIF